MKAMKGKGNLITLKSEEEKQVQAEIGIVFYATCDTPWYPKICINCTNIY